MVVRNGIPIGIFPEIGHVPFCHDLQFQKEIKRRSVKITDPELEPINFDCYSITYNELFDLINRDKFNTYDNYYQSLRCQLDEVLQLLSGEETKEFENEYEIKPADKLYLLLQVG
ncbi:MAG: hypothetical protein ACXAEU_14795 [Candidatus Hodarchaeales archaeon]|jgi:hypothetical protein